MHDIRPLIPLLVTAGILIGGNGLQGTFISLRALEEGFSASMIGVIGTGYNIGFAIGCIYVTRVIREIGHIRTFSALAAIASAASICMVLFIHPTSWFIMRLLQASALPACLRWSKAGSMPALTIRPAPGRCRSIVSSIWDR